MWDIVSLNNGQFTVLGSHPTSEAAQKALGTRSKSEGTEHFIFWSEKLPKDEKEADKILSKVFEINEGRVKRAMPGVKIEITIMDPACQGNCYCVVANNQRNCETYYCNVNHVCWWVGCGSTC